MTKYVLEAKNIHKTYKSADTVKVLKGVDLLLKKDQSIAIMGDSGEGKTTLLHILGLLETKDKGSLKILNSSKFSSNSLGKHIGFVFQSFNLLEDLTLLENILMPAYIARKNIKKGSPIYLKAQDLLKEVHLEKRADFLAKQLSGGEKQRAAIARAFLNDPDIILADEPSGNLDYKNSKIIHTLLTSFAKKLNKSLIVATHNKDLAKMCDQTYILKDGKLT